MATPAAAYTFKHSSKGAIVRWDNVDRVELRMAPGMERYLGPGQAYAAAVIAAEAWRGYAGTPEIIISDAEQDVPAFDPDVRHNALYVLSPWPYEPERLAVTVTSYRTTGELVGVDVLINGDVDYGLLPEPTVPEAMRGTHDLPAVLTHEFGHVLGLDESMDDPEATMWPYIRPGETHQRSLSPDDESAVIALYDDTGNAPIIACQQSSVLGGIDGASRTPMAWLGIGLLGLLARRRRARRPAAV